MYLLGKMAIVGAAHVAMGVLFLYARVEHNYYGRLPQLASVVDSDFLVLHLPTLVALAAYFYVLWRSAFPKFHWLANLGLVAMLATAATAASCPCTMIIAFNKFGT